MFVLTSTDIKIQYFFKAKALILLQGVTTCSVTVIFLNYYEHLSV